MVNLRDPVTIATKSPSWDMLAKTQASVCARAPGKLIISGEHSVLYDQPALALAINRYTTCIATPNTDAQFGFNLLDLAHTNIHSMQSLQECAHNLRLKYKQYLTGDLNVRKVIRTPGALLEYAMAELLTQCKSPLTHGINIEVSSNITIGCGLGSSAAAVLSTVHAVAKLLQLGCSSTELLSISQHVENLQHGRSSGLDLHLASFGGCVLFQRGQVAKRSAPTLPMFIVNTGQPQATTGECVSSAAQHLVGTGLAQEFGAVTRTIDNALLENNLIATQNGIKQNQRLLEQIGVVPTTVANFIAEVEQRGSAAKVCGAGSISGNNAGVVLIIGTQNLSDLVTKYGYSLETIEVDVHGTRII